MKITQFNIFLILIFFMNQYGFAQSNVEDLIKKGYEYHEQGQFDKAIETYKNALEIDPESPLANYELAYTYFSMGEYEKTIQYADASIAQDETYYLQVSILKGSSLDNLGRTKESNQLFEKALQKFGGHYLLYYNLALNYFKLKDLDKAEEYTMKAIGFNPNHSSSHLLLANIHNMRGNNIQTILATHYFLFSEPNTSRSKVAFQMLQEKMRGNVSENKDESSNTISIILNPSEDTPFKDAEFMLSMIAASNMLEENKGKTREELFIDNTKSLLIFLGEMNIKDQDIWWVTYVPFLYDIAKSEHFMIYYKFISQSNESSEEWLMQHEEEMNAFADWLEAR